MTRQIIVGADEAVSRFMQQTLNTPYGFESGRGIGVAEILPEAHGVTPMRLLAGIWSISKRSSRTQRRTAICWCTRCFATSVAGSGCGIAFHTYANR
jgi:hypothetical protein